MFRFANYRRERIAQCSVADHIGRSATPHRFLRAFDGRTSSGHRHFQCSDSDWTDGAQVRVVV
jgi:hypothetical protein